MSGFCVAIAIWEIAIKIKNQKLDLGVDLGKYVASLKKSNVVRIVPIDEDIWLESVKLQWDHKDPVDRVVVALASTSSSFNYHSRSRNQKFLLRCNWVG